MTAILRLPPRRWLLALYVVATAIVTYQRGVLHFANDFAIFRASFYNLLGSRDLYAMHPEQAVDIFKYSPSFAFLFGPFALLPFTLGLFCWNLLNALSLFFALEQLLPAREARLAAALVFLPMLRAMQSAQSNALCAALIIIAYVTLDRGQQLRAAFAVVLGGAIKLFPLAALSLGIVRPRPVRFWLLAAAAGVVAVALPLVAVSPSSLVAQYASWRALEGREALSWGTSVMGLLHDWGGLDIASWMVQAAGTAILLLPLALRIDRWDEADFRRRFLASLLVYCVIFNHKAERQSYVIALSGIVIWYLTAPRLRARDVLFGLVYALTSLLSSSGVPGALKAGLTPLHRQALPVTLVWLVMQAELLSRRRGPRTPEAVAQPQGTTPAVDAASDFASARDAARVGAPAPPTFDVNDA